MSPNNLNITFEAVMVDDVPKAPLRWILNDSYPDMGSLVSIWPTSEIAIFLRTLYLTDSPRLEQRLMKNVERVLGKRSLDEVSTIPGLPLGVGSPIAWALLWVPTARTNDGDVLASVDSGNHRLWPKLLLSLSVDMVPNRQPESNEYSESLPSRIRVDDGHTEIKSSRSLFEEALEIHVALARCENEKSLATAGDGILAAQSGIEASAEMGTKTDDCEIFGQDYGVHSGDWGVDNDGSQEDEDDLFASSPSPAAMDQAQASQEKPAALDSVDRVSTSMFTPTRQADTNFDVTKYDISPTNKGTPVKGYTGYEAMITDDDFDFFDGQEPDNQQDTYEEYGDLSNGDFGVNMNQAPSSLPGEAIAAGPSDVLVSALTLDTTTMEGDSGESFAPNKENSIIESPMDPMATPQDSIRSDDDLWNDNSLLEQFEEGVGEPITDMETTDDNRDPQVGDPATVTTSALDFDISDPVSAISTITPVHSAPALLKESDQTDYRQPLQWRVATAAENMTPIDFEEIIFDQPFFKAADTRKSIDRMSLTVDGKIFLADVYGDGRVRIRRGLMKLLEAEESARRDRNLGLLPFHSQTDIEDIDISSPRSIGSHDTQNSGESADHASEIASVSQAFEQGDCQGILQAGHYPFSELDNIFSRRNVVPLEEQDRNTLRRKIIEFEGSDAGPKPLLELSTVRSQEAHQMFELALASPRDLDSYHRFPSAFISSDQAEYNGETWRLMPGSRSAADSPPGYRQLQRNRCSYTSWAER
jgi:hypothetical protein